MKIGVVVHGPEVVDSGQSKLILDILSSLYDSLNAQLGGSMGKTAVIDAGLENLIDITGCLKPSQSIRYLEKIENCDIVCLLTQSKSVDNGHIFGNMVIEKLDNPKLPVLQIETQGSGVIIPWTKNSTNHAKSLSDLLGLKISTPMNIVSGIYKCGSTIKREISGVSPGECVFLNGIIIGRAESNKVTIVADNGFIKSIEGGTIKQHGVEKLHKYDKRVPVDIENAWIKTGLLRRSCNYSPQVKYNSTGSNNGFRVVLIDHDADNCFDLDFKVDMAVTIGDDTTIVAADIFYRFAVPVIGIVDGDRDEEYQNMCIYPGTCILKLKPGYDDILGKRIENEIFRGDKIVDFDTMESFKREIIYLGKEIIESVIQY
ncbi:conserved hypothetical protein [Methanohalobium evestigatum Z-7303]|uniref:DUF2117 domain-containing protein n=1 Tax=Methanohalobium evestigatum (strain ATCC BAA-1072 / DSM 3721 / NBRC 107634 / OCM 161 / Z-7303) TaxID=644295 RepID=D7E8Z1_METEZ|nr:DUF2117 domain-containing protein [Methanohalobium evestigatum]ADI73939.1 conserved hypothetical protein [Methanohalobium evestigatum Z-7303]